MSTDERIYFAYDWIVDDEGIADVGSLLAIAGDLGCESSEVPSQNPEGYYREQLVICAPSASIFNRFVITAAQQTKFKSWYLVSVEYFAEVSQRHGSFFRAAMKEAKTNNPLIVGRAVDTYSDLARHNQNLREKLESNQA